MAHAWSATYKTNSLKPDKGPSSPNWPYVRLTCKYLKFARATRDCKNHNNQNGVEKIIYVHREGGKKGQGKHNNVWGSISEIF